MSKVFAFLGGLLWGSIIAFIYIGIWAHPDKQTSADLTGTGALNFFLGLVCFGIAYAFSEG